MRSPKKDMAGVVSFIPNEKDAIPFMNQIRNLEFVHEDRLNENYEEANWYDFEVISVYENNDKVQGLSTAWHRPEYYPADTVRILSRYWKDPTLRLQCTHMQLSMPHLVDMIKHQMAMCKDLGFKRAFISREKSPRYFNKLIKSIQEKTNTEWHIFDDKQCVCHKDSPSCWQYKAEVIL